METQRWRKYPRKYNHKPTGAYCGGIQFDQSQMAEIEFERLLLWSGRFPKLFTQSHNAELTAEVYRRAAQVLAKRSKQASKSEPVELTVIRVSELGTWRDTER